MQIRDTAIFSESPLRGNIFENLIIAELLKQNEHRYLHQDYWFWRDSNGHEVDLLTQKGNLYDIFEIKSTQTIMTEHFAGLRYFDEISENSAGEKTLIYGGSTNQSRTLYTVKGWKNI
ncbi:DUF4143 domain-containing protein [Dyadobacter fermentans]|uniref:DUF4143 domain-containing protein n=1 Tax=Dyadobacter fermentans TaxID=94254 RepID=UPI0002F5DC79|nr:DUF4143 domain-containing protein [Dyadobacter fermentans]